MKQLLAMMLVVLSLTACGSRSTDKTASQETDETTVYVYYFHGKQRCKTCVAVEELTGKTVEDAYAGNPKVQYVEVKNYEPENTSLVEKYEVTWNALIIAKGDDNTDITKYAFANAVNSPEVLTELIKTEVDKRLAE